MVPAGADVDLSRLRVFVSVVDCNGYSAAAAHLNLSQATVSFHIRELERVLGTKLLIYEHHKLRLTTAGEEVYRAAARMLHDADRLVHSVRDVGRGYSDRLALGVSMAFEQRYFFERLIRPFCRAHPTTRLSLRFGHSVAEAEAVRTHEVDLAYVLGWHRPRGVTYEPLHHATFTFLVSPEHRLAREEVVTVEDIAKAGIIAAPLNNLEWSYYGRVLRQCGLQDAAPILEIDGIQARALAATAGLGVFATFCPPYAGEQAFVPLVPLRVERR